MRAVFFEDSTPLPKVGSAINSYTLEKMLYNTNNSVVFVSTSPESGDKVAIKFIKVRSTNLARVENEMQLLSQMNSPYIMPFKDIFDYPPYKCVVMPLALSDINEICEKSKNHRLTEDVVRAFMRYALLALAYLHENHIIHRDIKPDNFLFLGEEEDEPVQLSDFGFAKKVEEGEKCSEYLGTLNYAAPEIISGTPYDESVDIWSLGVTMFYLLSGSSPFPLKPESTLRHCILQGSYFFNATQWVNISRDAKDLVTKMIRVKPSSRITAKDALKHKWFIGRNEIPHSKSWATLSDCTNA